MNQWIDVTESEGGMVLPIVITLSNIKSPVMIFDLSTHENGVTLTKSLSTVDKDSKTIGPGRLRPARMSNGLPNSH